MTGMPAWEYRLADADIWSLVAIVKLMAMISPADYQEARAEVLGEQDEASRGETDQTERSGAAGPATLEPGEPENGRAAILQYACISCHQVPGIVGPDVRVGPPLEGIADRQFIAGVLPNTPENMIRWIMRPQEVNPLTAMPDMGVSEAHARDIAAYLDSVASR
jgi:cytochrome c2